MTGHSSGLSVGGGTGRISHSVVHVHCDVSVGAGDEVKQIVWQVNLNTLEIEALLPRSCSDGAGH